MQNLKYNSLKNTTVCDRILIIFIKLLLEGKQMSEILKNEFAQILQTKRKELNLTQEEVTKRCHISPRQYITLEHGLGLPTFQTLINISIALDLDYDIFISSVVKNGYKVPERN